MGGDWLGRLRQGVMPRRGTVAAFLALTAGGAVAAAFLSAVGPLWLSPLPQSQPDRLAVIWERLKDRPESPRVTSLGLFLHAQEQLGDLARFAVSRPALPIYRGPDTAFSLHGSMVSPSFLDVLGIPVAHGRDFLIEDQHRPGELAVILGHDLWQRHFGGTEDLATIDFKLEMGGPSIPTEVVGVLPARSGLGAPFVAWPRVDLLILNPQPPQWLEHELRYLAQRSYRVTARLHEAEQLGALEQALGRLTDSLEATYPEAFAGYQTETRRARELVVEPYAPALAILGWLALLVLISASVNVAILLATRREERAHELAMRAAVGAGPRQLMARLFLEELRPVLIALPVAAWIAHSWLEGIAQFSSVPKIQDLGLRPIDVVATAAILLVVPAFFALPAWITQRRRAHNPARDLLGGTRYSKGIRRHYVIAELMIGVLLLTCALALGRQLQMVLSQDLGFEADGVLTLDLGQTGPRGRPIDPGLYQRAAEAVTELSAVEHAGVMGFAPMVQPAMVIDAHQGDHWRQSVELDSVGPGTFEALDIPVIEGRPPVATDLRLGGADDPDTVSSAQPAVWISESLARLLGPGPVVGRSFSLDLRNDLELQIVGVVGDVRRVAPLDPPQPTAYLPFSRLRSGKGRLILKSSADDLDRVMRQVRQTIESLDPHLMTGQGGALRVQVDQATEPQRLMMRLAGVLATLALVLAMTGVMAATLERVETRRREAAIHFALGARERQIRARLLRPIWTDCLIGITLGGLVTAGFGSNLLHRIAVDLPPLAPLFLTSSVILLVLAGAVTWGSTFDLGRHRPADELRGP